MTFSLTKILIPKSVWSALYFLSHRHLLHGWCFPQTLLNKTSVSALYATDYGGFTIILWSLVYCFRIVSPTSSQMERLAMARMGFLDKAREVEVGHVHTTGRPKSGVHLAWTYYF